MLQLDSQVTRAEVGQLQWEQMDERYTVLAGEQEECCDRGANGERASCCCAFQLRDLEETHAIQGDLNIKREKISLDF